MFCDGCGNAVQSGQSFCSRCGKQILGPALVTQYHRNRVQNHIHLLGVLWLALSALNAIGGLILVIVANTLLAHLNQLGAPQEFPRGFLTVLVTSLGIIVLAKSVAGFFAGWGLMQREPWARVLALVLAFLSLFNVPLGTAVGVYTLWVLLPGQSQEEYDALVSAQAAA
jgi:hypothetical protein